MEQGTDKIIDLDKLYDLIDNKDNRKNNPFTTTGTEDSYNNLWEKIEELFKKVNGDIDLHNDLFDKLNDYTDAVRGNAFKIGYRTAVELILKPQGE